MDKFSTNVSGTTWWPISINYKWCHMVAEYWWNTKIFFQEILLIRFVRNILFWKRNKKVLEDRDSRSCRHVSWFWLHLWETGGVIAHFQPTSSLAVQVNHRQYHCFHHQAEAYAIYDTFGVTWWTNFQLMEVKPTVSQISNNCKWCHLVAKCWL